MERGQPLGDGFQLLIGLAEIHVPRMWVERHVSKPDSQVSGKCSEYYFFFTLLSMSRNTLFLNRPATS